MARWIRPETFSEMSAPLEVNRYGLADVDPNWVTEVLPAVEHPDLYEYFMLEDGQLYHRANRQGELEFFALIDDENPAELVTADWGLAVKEAHADRFVVNLLVYDRADDPLQMPFIFDFTAMEHRYEAAALCEQRAIPVYLLLRRADRLMVVCCRIIEHDTEGRDYFRDSIRNAYTDAKPVRSAGLPTERVRVERSLDILRGKEVASASTLVLKVPVFQAAHGPGNSFEIAIQMVMRGLVQADYKSEVTVWGYYGRSTYAFPAYYFSVTPFRNHNYVKVFEQVMATRAYEEIAGDVLRDGAVPLVKWSPEEGLIRLWTDPVEIPDFSPYSPAQEADRLYVQRGPASDFTDQRSLHVGKGTFPIQHRLFQVDWLRR